VLPKLKMEKPRLGLAGAFALGVGCALMAPVLARGESILGATTVAGIGPANGAHVTGVSFPVAPGPSEPFGAHVSFGDTGSNVVSGKSGTVISSDATPPAVPLPSAALTTLTTLGGLGVIAVLRRVWRRIAIRQSRV
jgi:hypothetical protein